MAWGQGATHFQNKSAQVLACKHTLRVRTLSCKQTSQRHDAPKGNLAELKRCENVCSP